MKPEDFRELLVKPGTLIGLVGDYGDDSEWSHGELIKGIVTHYLVVERRHNLKMKNTNEPIWDAGVVICLNEVLNTVGENAESFLGKKLLLIQRGHEYHWDHIDPDVHVFGIKDEKIFVEGAILGRDSWEPETIWLAAAAIMTIEEENALSEMAQAFRKRAERKQLEQLKPTK